MINQETITQFIGTSNPNDGLNGASAYDKFAILPTYDGRGWKICQTVAKRNGAGILAWAFFNNLNDAEQVMGLISQHQARLRVMFG